MNTSTHALAASALLSIVAIPAFAGGMSPVVEQAPAAVAAPVVVAPVAQPSFDWSGFYLGGQASYGQLEYEGDDDDATLDGATGGLHVGYMRDFGRFVAGVEMAYDLLDLELDEDDVPGFDADAAELEGVGRAGLRLGYDAGRVLPYATAGYAMARYSDDIAGTDEDTADGYYFGGGAEIALADSFSVGVEVLRHEFDLDIDDLDTSHTTAGLRASYRF